MLKRIAIFLVLTTMLGTIPLESWGSRLASGRPAPPFLVESGSSKKLTLDMIRGRVIVLYYTSRNAMAENSRMKAELLKVYRTQPADVKKQLFRLVVVDGSEASWPTMPLWKCKLNEHSKKEGFTIYADWQRKMMADYRLKENANNFLLIDKKGIIRYSASGKIANGQYDKIKELLFTLVQEG